MTVRTAHALGIALIAVAARADSVADLGVRLKDSRYKIRVAAAVALGKLGDKRGVPLLIEVLHDENETVRGVAAAALGELGDPSAATALQAAMRDANGFVRAQAEKALAALASVPGAAPIPAPGAPPPTRPLRFYVELGAFANKAGAGGDGIRDAARDAMAKWIDATAGEVAARWDGGKKPKTADLRARGVQAFFLDGSVLSVTRNYIGANVEIDCKVNVLVGTWPDRSIKSFVTQEAGIQNDRRSFRSDGEPDLMREACAEAVRAAADEKILPYLRSQSP